jgi:hypothetical protein
VEVGHGVVGVVLGLPPVHGEALPEVTDNDTGEVTIFAVLENLVMEEIVSEPTTLLPEKAEDDGANQVDNDVVGIDSTGDSDADKCHVSGDFINIVSGISVEKAGSENFGTKLSITLLELLLLLGLQLIGIKSGGNDTLVKIANLEFLEISKCRSRVECSEDIGHVVAGVSKDNGST